MKQSLEFLLDNKVSLAQGIRKQLDIPEALDVQDEALPKPIRTIVRIWKTDTFEKLCSFCEENPNFLQVTMPDNTYEEVIFDDVVITQEELGHIKDIGFSLRDAELMARGLRQNKDYDSITLGSLISSKNYDMIIDLMSQYSHEWRDLRSVMPQFKLGVATFGFKQMCRYANNTKISKHDTLFAFDKILELQALSGLRPSAFYGQIMAQAAKSTALYAGRVGQLHLNDIATTMDRDIPGVLAKAQLFTAIKKLQEAAKRFSNPAAVFASWDNLIRFHQLSRQIERKEGLDKLATYRAQGKHKLCDFAETIAFHEDSDVDVSAVMEFVEKPNEFLARQDPHAPPELQSSKKPSNYTAIPHLGLTAADVRDSLPEGNIDVLQTVRPFKIDYRIPMNPNQTVSERRTKLRNAIDQGKPASGKAFTKMNRVLQQHATDAKTFLTADEIPTIPESALLDIEDIARKDLSRFYDDKTFVVVAEIHPKSSPEGIIAGDDTDCCMRFGYGKNNVFMYNPGDAIFTVRLEKNDESFRTISQSLMTTDIDIGRSVPEVHKALQQNSKLTDVLPGAQLKRSTVYLSADNVEVATNYKREPYLTLLENVYRDFFAEYLARYGEEENLSKVIPVGMLHSDALKDLTQMPNTFVPETPLSYSDKLEAEVGDLKPVRVYSEAHKVVTETERQTVQTDIPNIPGIARLTSRDTLPVAYLEEQIYLDNATLQVHLHNIENGLIAKDIANVRRNNPELCFKYEDKEGQMHGYMIAYQGTLESTHLPDDAPDEIAGQEAIYIADLAADTKIAGASLIKAFIDQYLAQYLEKGQLLPIYTEAKEKTAYQVILNQLSRRGKTLGFEFSTQEFKTHKSGKDTMHPILILPHKRTSNPNTKKITVT